MKKLLLISALLLFGSNGLAENRVIAGSVAQKCVTFLSTYETQITNGDDEFFAKMMTASFKNSFISYLSGRNVSLYRSGSEVVKNLVDNRDFTLAYVKNECTKYPDKAIFVILDNYYDQLPYYIE